MRFLRRPKRRSPEPEATPGVKRMPRREFLRLLWEGGQTLAFAPLLDFSSDLDGKQLGFTDSLEGDPVIIAERLTSPETLHPSTDNLPFFTEPSPSHLQNIQPLGTLPTKHLAAVEPTEWAQQLSESSLGSLGNNINFTLNTGEPTPANLVRSLNCSVSHPAVGTENLTQHFGRHNPALYGDWFGGTHTGTDYLGEFPYTAPFEAEVVAIGSGFDQDEHKGLGPNAIFLRSLHPVGHDGEGHNLYLYAVYGHGQSVVPNLVVGDVVRPGEILGLTGALGNTTETHLHFETALGPHNALNQTEQFITWKDPSRIIYFDSSSVWNHQLRRQLNNTATEDNLVKQMVTHFPEPDEHFDRTGYHADPKEYGSGQLNIENLPAQLNDVTYVITVNINDGSLGLWQMGEASQPRKVFDTKVLVGQKLKRDYVLSGSYAITDHAQDGSYVDGQRGVHYNHRGIPRDTLTPPMIARVNGFAQIQNFAHVDDLTSIADISALREDGSFDPDRSQYTINQIPPVQQYANREQALLARLSDVGCNFSTGCVNVATRDWQRLLENWLSPAINEGKKVYVIFSYPGIDHQQLLLPTDYEVNRDDPFLAGGLDNWYNRTNKVSFREWAAARPEEASQLINNFNDLAKTVIQTYLDQCYAGVDQPAFAQAINFWQECFPEGKDQRLTTEPALTVKQQTAFNIINGWKDKTLPALATVNTTGWDPASDVVFFSASSDTAFNSWMNSELGPLGNLDMSLESLSYFETFLGKAGYSIDRPVEIPRSTFLAAEVLWRLASNNRSIDLTTALTTKRAWADQLAAALYSNSQPQLLRNWNRFFQETYYLNLVTVPLTNQLSQPTPYDGVIDIMHRLLNNQTVNQAEINQVQEAFQDWQINK